jgi:hypothetical protein
MQEHGHFEARALPASPESRNTGQRNQSLGPCSWVSGGPDGPSRNDTRVFGTLRELVTTAAQRSTNDYAKKHECGEQADRGTPEGCSAGIVSQGYEDGKWRAEQDDPHCLVSSQKAAAQLVGCQKSRRYDDRGQVVGECVGSSEERGRGQYCRLQFLTNSRAPDYPHDDGTTESNQSLNQPSQMGRTMKAADQSVRGLEISPVAVRVSSQA